MHKFSLTTTCLVDAPELCWIFGDSTFRIFWNYILGRSGFRCWTAASTQWISMVEVRFRTELLTAEQGRPLSCNKKPIHLGADSAYNRRFHLVSIDSVGALGKVGLDALPAASLVNFASQSPVIVDEQTAGLGRSSSCRDAKVAEDDVRYELNWKSMNYQMICISTHLYSSKTFWFLIPSFFHWRV